MTNLEKIQNMNVDEFIKFLHIFLDEYEGEYDEYLLYSGVMPWNRWASKKYCVECCKMFKDIGIPCWDDKCPYGIYDLFGTDKIIKMWLESESD